MLKRLLKKITLLFNLTLFLGLAGCAQYPLDIHYRGPEPIPDTLKEEYAYQRVHIEPDQTLLKKNNYYALEHIEFNSSHNIVPIPHKIKLDYYHVNSLRPAPVILVLPILGGSNLIAKAIASFFAQRGYAAIIVFRNNDFKKFNDLKKVDRFLRQMVLDHRQVVDWIETQTDLDSTKIGLFGVSMGGIKGALVASLEKRIRASVIALSGGDLPYIFTYSNEPEIVHKRSAAMKKEGLNRKEMYNQLKGWVHCDPINYAKYLDARNVLMILAKYDDKVPIVKGEALRHEMGRPETIYLYTGHYTALPFIYYVTYKAMKFFNRKL